MCSVSTGITGVGEIQSPLALNEIYLGDSRDLLKQIDSNSIACSIWSPPYHTGKKYEAGMTYQEWQNLLKDVIKLHYSILKPGAFLAINIADILAFPDPTMPKIQAMSLNQRKQKVTLDDILNAMKKHPDYNRYQLAELLECSEQTIDRRLHGNNIRGGKYATQTRVKLVGGELERFAHDAGLYLYDRRIWVKDPSWANSRWHSLSYRSVDEFEYVYIFWKPGITVVDRNRLAKREWVEWGSRGVWYFHSVRANYKHEAMFPLELPRRLILLLTDKGDTVLDCFVGSGTTAIAAIRTERNFIGIDKEKTYVEMSRKACEDELRQKRINRTISR
jgi:site-specific DNA-methyltransferase (adenine-specific)